MEKTTATPAALRNARDPDEALLEPRWPVRHRRFATEEPPIGRFHTKG